MPYATKVVKADLSLVRYGIEAQCVRGEAMFDVIPRDRGFVESHQSVKRFRNPSQVEYGVYGEWRDDLRL